MQEVYDCLLQEGSLSSSETVTFASALLYSAFECHTTGYNRIPNQLIYVTNCAGSVRLCVHSICLYELKMVVSFMSVLFLKSLR